MIRDTPQKVAAAEQLVHDLDRSKAEIVMDVSVVEADRDRARDLGLYPATVIVLGHDNTWIAGWGDIRSSYFIVIVIDHHFGWHST